MVHYLCTSCLLPAFDDAYCDTPVTEWCHNYVPCYLLSVSNSVCFSSMSVRQAAQRRIGLCNIRHRISYAAKDLGRYLSCTRCMEHGNDFELILIVKMETRRPVEGYFGSEFPAICNRCGVMAAWSRKTWIFVGEFLHFFPKTTPYRKIFNVLLVFIATPIDIVVFKFREIWPTGNRQNRALFTRQKNFACLSNCRYGADCAQNLPGPTANNVLSVLQISSKLVHFRQSYSQMREHH